MGHRIEIPHLPPEVIERKNRAVDRGVKKLGCALEIAAVPTAVIAYLFGQTEIAVIAGAAAVVPLLGYVMQSVSDRSHAVYEKYNH